MEQHRQSLTPREAERLRALLKGPGKAAYGSFLAKTGDEKRASALSRELLRELAESISPEEGENQVYVRSRALLQRKLAVLELEQAQAAWAELEAQRVPVYTGVAGTAPAPDQNQWAETPARTPAAPGAMPPAARETPLGKLSLETAPAMPAPRPADAPGETEQRAAEPLSEENPAPRPVPNAPAPSREPARQRQPRPAPRPLPGKNLTLAFLETLGALVLILLCLILTWCSVGMLMRLGVIPKFDLGYTFFNTHIYPLF